MNGFTEDLLNGVVRDIEQNWEKKGGNLSYFVNHVRKSGLTTKDLDSFLTERGDTCPECVNNVFSAIVFADFLKKEGGEK